MKLRTRSAACALRAQQLLSIMSYYPLLAFSFRFPRSMAFDVEFGFYFLHRLMRFGILWFVSCG